VTVALLGFDAADLIDDIEISGAATFFEFAGKADICLFI
jgi:peroxiredoxin family protein